jgi:MraZ protein
MRILIPKKLLEYAELNDDVVLSANGNKVEIWSQYHYDTELMVDSDELSSLAQHFHKQKSSATE